MTSVLSALAVCLGLGAVLGCALGIANKVFEVKVDPRLTEVSKLLPGYNCGACGYPGCSGLAEAIMDRNVDRVICKPIKPDQKTKIIEYLANTPGPEGDTIQLKA